MKRLFLLALAGVALAAVPARAANPVVVIETSVGNIKVMPRAAWRAMVSAATAGECPVIAPVSPKQKSI